MRGLIRTNIPDRAGAAGPVPARAALPVGARRARLRTDVTLAARVLPVHYPLQAFIAVNPLNGLLEQPFGQALAKAGDLYGAPGTLPEPWFRATYAAGRITDADLAAALEQHHPGLLATPPPVVGRGRVTAWPLLRADLLHGTPAPPPVRRFRTLSEQAAPKVARTVDDLTGKWCAAYLGASAWPMPGREHGLYSAWRDLAQHDRSLGRAVRVRLADLPERADDALLHALDLLAIATTAHQAYLRADLTRLPGWAAHARWHTEHPQPAEPGDARNGLTLLDYLAVRLSCEALLLHQAGLLPAGGHPATADTVSGDTVSGDTVAGDTVSGDTVAGDTVAGDTVAGDAVAADHVTADPDVTPTGSPAGANPTGGDTPEPRSGDGRAATALAVLGIHDPSAGELAAAAALLGQLPVSARPLLWLQAYEGHYRDQLLSHLTVDPPPPPPPAPVGRPRAQVVCCIDVRSEGLRRHLEDLHPPGTYETLGFAGFFAVAIRYTDLAGGAATDLCPVLIPPSTAISETPAPGDAGPARRRVVGLRVLAGGAEAFHAGKDDLLSPFTLAEAGGVVAAPLAAARTAAPGLFGRLRQRLHRQVAPAAPTMLSVEDGFPLPERVLYAQVALTTMGLTRGFARLVVLCGHGSSTENNPYQAALDCGACGGHRGAPNARTAAAILNDPGVRAQLPALGITVPADTIFVAAEHDTATDRVTLLDPHLIPAGHRPDVDQLDAALATAGGHLATERAADLPGAPAHARRTPRAAARHAAARAADWAQVYPEWGLAGNAAFLIGPRSLSRGLNLGRRVFLHSYDPDVDPDGTALETILTAPLVVAQWINAQYYFSAVAPHVFGAGSKTVHNVLSGLGVLAGQTGDLQLGLPWQSVAVGDRLVHEPMRLLALAQAPLERIEAVIDRNPILQQLFGNQWITLTARVDPTRAWQLYTHPGWLPWQPTPSSPFAAPAPSDPTNPAGRTS